MTDDRTETIHDRALIRDSDEPDERGDFPCCAAPAPVGAAVALDLDAICRRVLDGDMPYTVMTEDAPALVAEVRRKSQLAADNHYRAEAAEAEVVTLRAKVAALQVAVSHSAESCADGPCEFHETVARAESAEAKVAAVEAVEDSWSRRTLPWPAWPHVHHWLRDLRAALAGTTGEGQ